MTNVDGDIRVSVAASRVTAEHTRGTLKLDTGVIREAKAIAAKEGTSVSTLLAENLWGAQPFDAAKFQISEQARTRQGTGGANSAAAAPGTL